MTLEQIFDDMTAKKVKYMIYSSPMVYYSAHVKVEGTYNGIQIACEDTVDFKKGQRPSEVIAACYERWLAVVGAGCPALLTPPIEAKRIETYPDGPEMPF